jgi:hypothetical protein
MPVFEVANSSLGGREAEFAGLLSEVTERKT